MNAETQTEGRIVFFYSGKTYRVWHLILVFDNDKQRLTSSCGNQYNPDTDAKFFVTSLRDFAIPHSHALCRKCLTRTLKGKIVHTHVRWYHKEQMKYLQSLDLIDLRPKYGNDSGCGGAV